MHFRGLGVWTIRRNLKRNIGDGSTVRQLYRVPLRLLSRQDLYALFQRVLNISTVPTNIWPEVLVQNILRAHKSHFSLSRNQLIYGSRFWFNLDDLLGECLSLQWTKQAQRNFAAYTFSEMEPTTEIDCYCDSWTLFLMSSKLHEVLYGSFNDSLDVFGYIKSRKPDFLMIERQF